MMKLTGFGMECRTKVETDPRAWVRPGRFLACVQLTQQELQRRADRSGDAPPAAVMERLEAIRRESLLALQVRGLPLHSCLGTK